MERSLLYGALALGCVGFACGVALTQSRERPPARGNAFAIPRMFLITAGLLPLLVFLLTLPTKAPFTAGHGFGIGFASGGIGALLAAWLIGRTLAVGRENPLFGAALSAGPLSVSVVAVACVQILLRDNLIDGLAGTAIGWFSVTMTVLAGLLSSGEQKPAMLPLASGTGFTTAVSAIALLGAYRGGEELASVRWSATGIALGAAVPFVVYLCSLSAPLFARVGLKTPFPRLFSGLLQRMVASDDGRAAASRFWRVLVASGLMLLVAWLLSTRVLNNSGLFTSAAAGVVAGWICWWMITEGRGPEARSPQFVPVAVLLLLGVAVIAFNRLAGFGVGVAMVGAWLSMAMAQAFVAESQHESADLERVAASHANLQGLFQLLVFGLGFLVYRVVTTRFSDDLRGVGLADHYGIAGFLTGAVAPVLIASWLTANSDKAGAGKTFTRLLAAGLLTLAVPALALILWRSKVALAVVAGMSVAAVSPLWAPGSASDSESSQRHGLLQSLFALGFMLALAQWTHHALQFASLTREAKVGLLTWIVGGLAAAMLILDVAGRFASRRSGDVPSVPASEGGSAK